MKFRSLTEAFSARSCWACGCLLYASCSGNAELPGDPFIGSQVSAAGTSSAGSSGASGRPATRTDIATSTAGRAGMGAVASAGRAAVGAAGRAAAGQGAIAGQPALAGQVGASGISGTGGSGGAAGSAGAAANSGPCEFPEPPGDVADWVEESWGDQLGNNIRSREAWNLDHVILNKGSLNLCVRWGATMPVPASVRDNIAATTERWFNDWFKGLAGYGCFPYGAGIKVKVTGWAVRPGSESLLEGVDPAIPIYTEV
ncbi:MAG TPA: hypothetical protein VMF89_00770, partial [Polyangiales bacterium]|nr:hypothetical protein [Polyangiales bacterium]